MVKVHKVMNSALYPELYKEYGKTNFDVEVVRKADYDLLLSQVESFKTITKQKDKETEKKIKDNEYIIKQLYEHNLDNLKTDKFNLEVLENEENKRYYEGKIICEEYLKEYLEQEFPEYFKESD